MLEVRSLSGGWAETAVVESVSLQIAAGESVAITGRNGVGKTTFLELIMGRANRHAGRVEIAGSDVSGWRTYRRARLGAGYVPQEREVFPSLTVAEHLSIVQRDGRWNAASLLELFPPLARRFRSLGSQLSGGEQQMLAIARALAANPRILLMDEPTEGLAPVLAEQLIEALRKLLAGGDLAVLLVEQRIDVALALSTRCVVMDRGRIVHEASSDALKSDSRRLAELIGLES